MNAAEYQLRLRAYLPEVKYNMPADREYNVLTVEQVRRLHRRWRDGAWFGNQSAPENTAAFDCNWRARHFCAFVASQLSSGDRPPAIFCVCGVDINGETHMQVAFADDGGGITQFNQESGEFTPLQRVYYMEGV